MSVSKLTRVFLGVVALAGCNAPASKTTYGATPISSRRIRR